MPHDRLTGLKLRAFRLKYHVPIRRIASELGITDAALVAMERGKGLSDASVARYLWAARRCTGSTTRRRLRALAESPEPSPTCEPEPAPSSPEAWLKRLREGE